MVKTRKNTSVQVITAGIKVCTLEKYIHIYTFHRNDPVYMSDPKNTQDNCFDGEWSLSPSLPHTHAHNFQTFKDHEYGNVSVQDKSSSSSLTYSADPWCHHDTDQMQRQAV